MPRGSSPAGPGADFFEYCLISQSQNFLNVGYTVSVDLSIACHWEQWKPWNSRVLTPKNGFICHQYDRPRSIRLIVSSRCKLCVVIRDMFRHISNRDELAFCQLVICSPDMIVYPAQMYLVRTWY